jgi:tetratricopeptide (TPR) repeat protein
MMSSGSSRARALPLLEQAVETDPDFASAHLLLYYLYMDRDQRDRALQHLSRARELADTASERERLFILSTDYSSRPEEISKGIEIAEILVGIYPDHFWATSNLASLNQELGRYDRAYPWRLHRADLRPNEGWSNLEAVFAATVFEDANARAPYLARAERLATDNRWLRNRLALLPFYETWLSGDMQAAADRLNGIVSELGDAALAADPSLADIVRSAYLGLGELDRYEALSRTDGAPDWLDAVFRADSGDPEALRAYLDQATGTLWDAALMAWSGRTEEAQAMVDYPLAMARTPWPYFRPNFKYLARGELALSRGRAEEAIRQLETALHLLSVYSIAHYLYGLHALARAQLMSGDTPAAIATLESGIVEKPWSIFEPGATYLWLRNQSLLAELYDRTGRADEARRLEDELRLMRARPGAGEATGS